MDDILIHSQDDFGSNLGAEASGWYGRADSFHGSPSSLWINPPSNQHQHHQPVDQQQQHQQHHHLYSTEDDESYVGQSVIGIGWKDVDTLNQAGVLVTSSGHLLHPHLQHHQQQQQ